VYSRNQSALPSLRIQTTNSGSATRLASGSQTNLASAVTQGSNPRSRYETISPTDTVSPISRSSLDGKFRLRSKSEQDPATVAESIRAARQAFSEKERAKDEKVEKEQLKQAQRRYKKQVKRREQESRKSSQSERKSKLKRSPSNLVDEKTDSVGGREYETMTDGPSTDVNTGSYRPSRRADTTKTAKSKAQSNWLSFMVWLRTRILKLGRKFGGS